MEQGEDPAIDSAGQDADGLSSSDARDVGAVLEDYEIVGVLGKGGMGAVLEGRQKSINRPVAIKIMSQGDSEDGFRFADRFQREVHVLAQMNHPNIITVYHFGQTDEGKFFFVMEYVKGEDLYSHIHKRGINSDQIFKWLDQICDALFYAHSMGVIHRDIKPANILITEHGDVKIADFGLAKLTGGEISDDFTQLTMTNMAVGTPHYIAPEVFEVGIKADHRADIYAVGVMLYEMLTGTIPRGILKPPSTVVEGLHKGFDEIIVKATDQDPNLRYQDIRELSADLMKIRNEPATSEASVTAQFADPQPERQVMVADGNQQAANVVQNAGAKPRGRYKASSAKKKKSEKKGSDNPLIWWVGIPAVITAILGIALLIVQSGKAKKDDSTVNIVPYQERLAQLQATQSKVAHWVYSKGGYVQIAEYGAESERQVYKESDLPETGYDITRVFFNGAPRIPSEELSIIGEANTIKCVLFHKTWIDDEGLAILGKSLPLVDLTVYENENQRELTGKCLESFQAPEEVAYVNFQGSSFDDESMKLLVRGQALLHVDLNDTKITDAGLAMLSGNSTLKWLDVAGTDISSKGLDQLRGLTSLTRLDISNCPNISRESRAAFQQAHPNCEIIPPLE